MDIIEQIEIKNFRSFGNRKKESYKLNSCQTLNVISGANDSGKSNILRALNLFFNKQTTPNQFFQFDKDFFKKDTIDEYEIQFELVTIKIWFNNFKNSGKNKDQGSKIYLPEKFWVSRKWKKSTEIGQFDQDSSIEKDFADEKGGDILQFQDSKIKSENVLKSTVVASLQKQLTDFIHSIQFHYVPAIKDVSYFAHLYGELQQTLWKTKNSAVEIKKIEFEKSIQHETNQLMEEFRMSLNFGTGTEITPIFELPADLINLFRALVVQTGHVDLTLRGDGFQAKLIPEILNFIAVKELEFTSKNIKSEYKAKKYFIWGFEEPENSYEYKNAQRLAERFRDIYSKNAQIFITTHSFNFLSLRGDHIGIYRVWKDSTTRSSKISKIKIDNQGTIKFEQNIAKSDWDTLQDELGFFYLNEELNALYQQREKTYESLKEKVHEIHKPIIYSEGNNVAYLERAKNIFLPDVDLDIQNIGGKNDLKNMFSMLAKTSYDRHKIFFVFDCDAVKEYDVCMAVKNHKLFPYIFPINKKCTIPDLAKGIENLFDDDVINSTHEKRLFSIVEVKVDDVVKSRNLTLRKNEFCNFILNERNNDDDFKNFKSLFDKVRESLNR